MDLSEAAARLSNIRCFVLDMDGTIYLGGRLFPFTKSFLNKSAETGREVYYFTNNSSKNAAYYIQKLAGMGITVPPDRMMTSNQVMIRYLQRNHPGKRVLAVGTSYLLEDFVAAGVLLDDHNPEIAVLGFDTTLTYEKLQKLCDAVRKNLPYYAVNPDFNCPIEDGGWMPDCGSIAALVQASAERAPVFMGKPSRHTLSYILEKTGFDAAEIAVVGDRLYTDIALAKDSNVLSVLVMTGETTPEILRDSCHQPDLVFDSLKEIECLL